MTFFATQTLSQNITKLFQYFPTDGSFSHSKHPYDEIVMKIPKNIIPHQNYLKIKKINIKAQIAHNNYESLKLDWQAFLDSKTVLKFHYRVNGKTFFIKHQNLHKNIINNFDQIENALLELNPLYNNIDELPILEFEILNDIEFPDGFETELEINFIPTFTSKYHWKGFATDRFTQFYWTVVIDYQTEV